MRCRECGTVTLHPVCEKCASADEGAILEKLTTINKQLQLNKKELLKSNLKLPVISPVIILILAGIVLYGVLTLILTNGVNEPFLQMVPAMYFPFVLLAIIIYWGKAPPENVVNAVNTVNLKQENLIMKRHKKYFIRLLKKPDDNWNKDDKFHMLFETMES